MRLGSIFFHSFCVFAVLGTISKFSWASINITQRKPLDFTAAAGGDPAEVIAPDAGGQFSVTGDPGASFILSFPSRSLFLRNGGNSLEVSNLLSKPARKGTFDRTGNAIVHVGGTRNVLSASQTPGNYAGNFTLLVNDGTDQGSVQAEVNERVLASISVTKISDLNFGTRAAGDPSKTIAAGAQGSASFAVQGEPNKQYLIVVPRDVVMNINSPRSGSKLKVSALTLNIPQTPTLPANGRQSFAVGATAEAISSNQESGMYTGSILISVTYQ